MKTLHVKTRVTGILRYGDSEATEAIHGVFCLLVFMGLPQVFYWAPKFLYGVLLGGVLFSIAGILVGSFTIRNLGTMFCVSHHIAALMLLHVKIPTESIPLAPYGILWYGLVVFLWLGWKVKREELHRQRMTRRRGRRSCD